MVRKTHHHRCDDDAKKIKRVELNDIEPILQ